MITDQIHATDLASDTPEDDVALVLFGELQTLCIFKSVL